MRSSITKALTPIVLTGAMLGGTVALAPSAMARPVIEEPEYYGPAGDPAVKQMQPLDKKLGGGVSTSGWDWFDRSCVRIWPWEKCPKK